MAGVVRELLSRRRRAGRRAPPPAAPSLPALRERIERLTDANRARPSAEREREILAARHLAGIALIAAEDPDAMFAQPAAELPSADGGLPELPADRLTAGLLRAAILRDGCALVRGLIDPRRARALADGIDLAYESRRAREREPAAAAGGYYDEFIPDPRFAQDLLRDWIKVGGGLLGVDSPRLTFQFTEALREAGVDRLVADYLGEPALVSSHKTTMRIAEPDVAGQWHQDGRFMGPVRSLNLWLALSRCGDVAPGLDVVPVRLEEYVATGTEGAALSWTISDEQAVAAAGGRPVLRPIFEPGDALLFDELFLHKTGSDPSMPRPRYAIENWFFGASGFPSDYAPIAL
jgi:Phytanoyl-CoA dioxygenase (PhyH)